MATNDKEKLSKAESWDLIKKYIPRQTKVRAIFVPKVNVISSKISFSFSVQQILVPKYEEKENDTDTLHNMWLNDNVTNTCGYAGWKEYT